MATIIDRNEDVAGDGHQGWSATVNVEDGGWYHQALSLYERTENGRA